MAKRVREWERVAGPFPSMQAAVEYRKQGHVKHKSNLSGVWRSCNLGRAGRRTSQCAHAEHVNCPVRLAITEPRSGEDGIWIEVSTDEHVAPSIPELPMERRTSDGRLSVRVTSAQRVFAAQFFEMLPSATPKELLRAFTTQAKAQGAQPRTGRESGYIGEHNTGRSTLRYT